MNKILTTLFIGLMLTVGGTIANAGPYEDGLAAFKHRDFATAKRLLRPFAEQGSAEAQHKLGEMYEGAPQNLAEAEKWYKRAADQGHVLAQVGLGLMYSRSEKWNAPEAMKWFRLAAEKGYAPAQRWLGNRYRNGWNRDVPQNYAAMLHWYEKAAEQGDAEAQYQLGVVFRNGEGVPQNEAEAMKWFRLSGYPIPKQDQFRWYGARGEAMAPSSLQPTDGAPHATAQRLEQISVRSRTRCNIDSGD